MSIDTDNNGVLDLACRSLNAECDCIIVINISVNISINIIITKIIMNIIIKIIITLLLLHYCC